MKALAVTLGVASVAFVYVWWVRPYLQTLPSLAEAWERERTFTAVLKSYLEGRKTILIGIWGEIVAFLPDALQGASGLDLKTLFMMPDAWAAWVTAFIPVLMLIFRAKAK